MNPRQASVYRALGLGPVWQLRETLRPAVAEGPSPVSDRLDADVPPAPALRPDGPVVEHERAPAEASAQSVADAGTDTARLGWDDLERRVSECRLCGLCKTRKQTVFGVGSHAARVLIVGEAPGQEEDLRGEPFVGQAGRLLDNMLVAIGMTRAEHVYIANVLKCRPPGNRNPEPTEVAACEPYLKQQVELLAPALIVVMGRFAAQALVGTEASIASLRGKRHAYALGSRSIPMVVTYHPAYLLRNLPDKSKAWSDLLFVRQLLAELDGAALRA